MSLQSFLIVLMFSLLMSSASTHHGLLDRLFSKRLTLELNCDHTFYQIQIGVNPFPMSKNLMPPFERAFP